jgi:hypothetical protein
MNLDYFNILDDKAKATVAKDLFHHLLTRVKERELYKGKYSSFQNYARELEATPVEDWEKTGLLNILCSAGAEK